MKRRQFLTNTSLGLGASAFMSPFAICTTENALLSGVSGRKAKNIIFMVSDGMSSGTLTMADVFLKMKEGRGSHWLNLYREQRVSRGLMDMASANSVVTDSAAASSSWGGGKRVKNGRLNIGDNGEEYMPILQKFKATGKKVGCVTTVPITHATPAGFCVTSKTRAAQADIAEQYLKLRFDVMMGGGAKYFTEREDSRNLFDEYRKSGFQLITQKSELSGLNTAQPVMGVFDKDGLPYEIDRIHITEEFNQIPSLAEMTDSAINLLKDHSEGFVMQVEGGKVDWAAHANDAAALIYDQIAFDDAVNVAINFAEKDGNTLVVITSDHGNSNPGLYSDKKANEMFSTLFEYQRSNSWILNQFNKNDTPQVLNDMILTYQGYSLDEESLKSVHSKYHLQSDSGLYNEYKLPFEEYARYQSKQTSVAFGGDSHTADYTELAMFGPGSQDMKSFMLNTEMHSFLLDKAGVENKF